MHALPGFIFEDMEDPKSPTHHDAPRADSDHGDTGVVGGAHYLVVEQTWEDGEPGNWGTPTSLTGQQSWFAYIDHPAHCLDEMNGDDEIQWRTCGMEDWLDTEGNYEDWPDPPFRIPVFINSEEIRGFDWVEYDAWLEPDGGFPPSNCPNDAEHGRLRLNYEGDEEQLPIWSCDTCHLQWEGRKR